VSWLLTITTSGVKNAFKDPFVSTQARRRLLSHGRTDEGAGPPINPSSPLAVTSSNPKARSFTSLPVISDLATSPPPANDLTSSTSSRLNASRRPRPAPVIITSPQEIFPDQPPPSPSRSSREEDREQPQAAAAPETGPLPQTSTSPLVFTRRRLNTPATSRPSQLSSLVQGKTQQALGSSASSAPALPSRLPQTGTATSSAAVPKTGAPAGPVGSDGPRCPNDHFCTNRDPQVVRILYHHLLCARAFADRSVVHHHSIGATFDTAKPQLKCCINSRALILKVGCPLSSTAKEGRLCAYASYRTSAADIEHQCKQPQVQLELEATMEASTRER